jgi:hypothetical protein
MPLVRALLADAAAAGCAARVLSVDTRGWSSATFTGARHRIVLAGLALDGWALGLSAAAIRLPRQWLGELVIEAIDADGVTLSALVLDDADAARA